MFQDFENTKSAERLLALDLSVGHRVETDGGLFCDLRSPMVQPFDRCSFGLEYERAIPTYGRPQARC